MQKILLVYWFILVANFGMAQRCGCYQEPTVDTYFYHTPGRMTATFGKTTVLLSHGIEIAPDLSAPVSFKVVAAPSILSRCKNTYLISVFDETERREIYTTHSETNLEFGFAFPRADRAYTVTLQVGTSNKSELVDPIFLRDQDCIRKLVVIVRPKGKIDFNNPTKLPKQ